MQQQTRSKDFELPDGTTLTIGNERTQFTESLFTQSQTAEGFTGL